jgi:hypothetical protein
MKPDQIGSRQARKILTEILTEILTGATSRHHRGPAWRN